MALLNDIGVGAAGDDPNKKIESLVKQINEWGRILSNEDRTNITKDDAGTERLLIGYQQGGFSNGDVGGKMSQEGTSVLTATGDQLIWSTDFNSFKIVETGTVSESTATTAGNTTLTTYAHNLGYRPVVFSYFGGVGAEGIPMPAFSVDGAGAVDQKVYLSAVNATDITFAHTERTGSGGPFSYKFYLMRETAG